MCCMNQMIKRVWVFNMTHHYLVVSIWRCKTNIITCHDVNFEHCFKTIVTVFDKAIYNLFFHLCWIDWIRVCGFFRQNYTLHFEKNVTTFKSQTDSPIKDWLVASNLESTGYSRFTYAPDYLILQILQILHVV